MWLESVNQAVVLSLVGIPLILWLLRRYLKGPLLDTSDPTQTRNKCIVITGCDSGFGRAAALDLAALGFPVFATCLTEEGQKSLNEEWASNKSQAFRMDVSDKSDIARFAQSLSDSIDQMKQHDESAGLWALVNNAGIMRVGEADILSDEDFQRCLEVNTLGPIWLSKALIPCLRETSRHLSRKKSNWRPRLVNVCSASVLAPMYGYSAYVTSKSALYAFSLVLRAELSCSFGVHVSTLLPGAFATDLLKMDSLSQSYSLRMRDQIQVYGEQFVKESHSRCIGGTRLAAQKNVTPVISAMKDALFRREPYERYIVGPDAWALWFLTFLPHWLADYLVSLPLQPTVQALFMLANE